MKKHAAPIIAAILMLLPVLYVGSYLALLQEIEYWSTPQGGILLPTYRVSGAWPERLFWPLEQIDRKVRPGAWEIDLPRYGDFGPTKLETPDLGP